MNIVKQLNIIFKKMANTGKVKYNTLYRVSTSGEPLDINDELCSVSGLPQSIKSNSPGDPDYKEPIYNNIVCPIPPAEDYFPLIDIIISEDSELCGSTEDYSEVQLYILGTPRIPIVGDVLYIRASPGVYVKYNPTNLDTYYPGKTYGTYIRFYDETNSKFYILTINFPDIIHDGRIIAITDCSSLLTNAEETRVYTKLTCSSPLIGDSYEVTIPAGTVTATTEELLLIAINNWFDINGQSQANTYGTCSSDKIGFDIWVVTGSPCSGTRTKTKLYINSANDKIYTDAGLTTLFTGTFFTENSTLTNYVVVTAGVAGDPINNTCPLPVDVRYDDFGTPSDISVFGVSLLACYPDKGVVVKYDTSVSTNPLGTVVAGVIGKTSLGINSPPNWLNTPMLVEWRDDGERFVVYSGGFYKSLKIFNKTGSFLYEGASMDSFDDEWTYNTPSDIVNGRYETPTSNTSLVGMLTARPGALEDLWVPTGLEYIKSPNSTFDAIFMPLWSKKPNSENHFKLYCIIPTPLIYFHGQSLTGNTCDGTGYADNRTTGVDYSGNDLIRGVQVIKKTVINSKSYKVRLAVVAPRTQYHTGSNDIYRYYDISHAVININAIPNIIDPSLDSPQVSPQFFSFLSSERINNRTRGVWKSNVKAELNFTSNTLVVVIKSSEISTWKEIIDRAGTAATYAMIGFLVLKAAIAVENILTWKCFAVLSAASPIAAVIVAVLVILAIIFLTPPKLRYVGSSAVVYTFTGISDAISDWDYYPGSYVMDNWVDNDLRKFRSVCMDSGNAGSLRLFTLNKDNNVSFGNWDADNSEGYIII